MNDFSQRLKDLRKKSGMSQTELSIKAGLSKNVVQQIEAGTIRSPSVENARNLARVLGVSASYLIDADPRQQPAPGFSDSAVTPWQPPRVAGQRPDLIENVQRIARTLAPHARTPATFRLAMAHPGFALRAGDVLIIDQAAKAEAGDIVIAQVVDYQTGTGMTVLRRFLPPYLVPDNADPDQQALVADGQRTSIMGPVVASFRAPDLERPTS